MTEKSLLGAVNSKYGGLSADEIKDMLKQGLDPANETHRGNYRRMQQFVNPVLPETPQQFHKHVLGKSLKYVPTDEEK